MAMVAAAAGAGGLLAATESAAANDVIHISSTKNASIKIAKGKPRTIKTNVPFYEIVIGDPEVANVNPLTDDSFYVLGNSLGTTGIALFDENKQLVGTVDIEVTLDTDRLASTIRNSVPGGEDIKVSSANGRVVLSGSANDQVAADKASKIASNFSGEEEVINSVNISSSQQVQLNVRFVEINREVGQELGTKIGVTYLGHNGGFSFNSEPSASTNAPAGELIGGLLSKGWGVDVAIKALEDRGLARRLAEPNLIARSGQKASFLAGGEVPIPVAEEEGVITVDYKKFGVGLDFTPTVLADGLIISRDRTGSVVDRPVGVLQCRQYLAPRLCRAARPDLGRSQERPELHDGGSSADRERHDPAARAGAGQAAGARPAVFVKSLSAPRNRPGDHRHALFGEADGPVEEAACAN